MLAVSVAAAAAAHSVPASLPVAHPHLRYQVTILPESRAAFVRGDLYQPKAAVDGWIAGDAGVGETNSLQAPAGDFAFGYMVALPRREKSNSTEAELDLKRFRAWGYSLFLIPSSGGKTPGPTEVCFNLPSGWQLATASGTRRCFRTQESTDLLDLPILAGEIDVQTIAIDGAEATIAVRRGGSLKPADYARRFRQLIRGASTYLAVPPPSRIFFGVDRLEGTKGSFPGNNNSAPGRSATLLIDLGTQGSAKKYWGTYAHEYVHSWVPSAFGNSQVTREQLGSVFIEGFSDYLAYRIAYASGLYDRAQFLSALSEFVLEYREAVGDPKTNPEFLRYRQGMMAAWVLDLELLRASRGRAGFRELMRRLLAEHSGGDGLTRKELESTLGSVGGARAATLYGLLSDTKSPIDLDRFLAGSGLIIRPVANLGAAIERGDTVVEERPRSSRERSFLQRWLAG